MRDGREPACFADQAPRGRAARHRGSAALPRATANYPAPARRVLLLRVRQDGRVSAMRCVLRGQSVTSRIALPTIGDANARAVYGEAFARAEFDAICARAWLPVARRWSRIWVDGQTRQATA